MPEVLVAVIQASLVKDVLVHVDIIVVLVLVDFVVPVGVRVRAGLVVGAVSSSEMALITLLGIVLSLSSRNRVFTGHAGLGASCAWRLGR
jgi:hypothetical protein